MSLPLSPRKSHRHVQSNLSVNAAYELQKSSALYLLTLKESITVIDFVVGHTKLAIDNIIDDLYQNVTKEIQARNQWFGRTPYFG